VTRHVFVPGQEFTLSSLPFRVRDGYKGRGDMVIDWFTPDGWVPVSMSALAVLVEFIYLNEDNLFPPPRFMGGMMLMRFLQDAVRFGHIDACLLSKLPSPQLTISTKSGSSL
jgi:hypothetical protein